MEPATRTLDPDARPNKILSFPNGALKKHHHISRPPPPAPPQAADLLYRECLKNHAASLGGHALDGCGEFMPSPAANPADPTSLKCAACGCHRNFHRRLPEPHRRHDGDDEQEGEDEMDGGDEDGQMEEDDGEDDRHRHGSSSSPPPYLSSAPHMLLALSSGGTGLGSNPVRPITPAAAAAPPGMMAGSTSAAVAVLPRKRFRTKFSPEQKEKMQELSERLRWRMQKRDEGLVEEFCRGIGVGKGVFKVWMHNNKHNFIPGSSSRRGEIGSSSSGGGGGGGIEGNSSGAGAGGGDSHVVNGPPPS